MTSGPTNSRFLLASLVILFLAGVLWWWNTTHRAPPAHLPDQTLVTRAQAANSEAPANEPPLTLLPAAVVEDAESLHGSIEGQVLSWGSGAGIAGAQLTFAHAGVTHEVIADPAGEFRFDVPEPGRFTLAVVSATGYLPFAPEWGHSPVVFSPVAGQRVRHVVLFLQPEDNYHGVVLDPEGRPTPGAEVRVLEARATSLVPSPSPARTNEEGQFTIVAPDGALLEGRHPSYAPGRVRIDLATRISHRLTIRLRPATLVHDSLTIAGTVRGPQGEATSDALVSARALHRMPAAPGLELRARAYAMSGAEGEFVLSELEPGVYSVVATAPGYMPARRDGVQAGTQGLALTLERGTTLSGRVIDRESEAPVPAFTIVASPHAGSLPRSMARSESILSADGRFVIAGLAPATYSVRAAAHGYAPSRSIRVQVLPETKNEIEIALMRGGRVHGTVVDEQTNVPLAGARVTCEGNILAGHESALAVLASSMTDARGFFELRGVGVGLRSIVVAAADHHMRIISGLEVTNDGDVGPLRVELAPVAEGEEPTFELCGIGAVLAPGEDGLTVGKTLAAGGAQKAGLGQGDTIVAIDGTPVNELEFREAVERIRGVEGTDVRLTVRRIGSTDTVEIVVMRRRVRG